jgi:hypothetical protein
VLTVIGCIFLAVGSLGVIAILHSLVRHYALLKLPVTPGTMLQCQPVLRSQRNFDDTVGVWGIDARFRYSVNGENFESTTFANLPPQKVAPRSHQGDDPPESIAALCRQFCPGTAVQVHYQPSSPRRSFVYFVSPLRDWPWALFPILAGMFGWFCLFAKRLVA